MQSKVEATTEDAPATGRPPCSPHRLTVHRVGLQAVPGVHSIPHLQGRQRQVAPDMVMKAYRKGSPRELGCHHFTSEEQLVSSSQQCTGFLSPGLRKQHFLSPLSLHTCSYLLITDTLSQSCPCLLQSATCPGMKRTQSQAIIKREGPAPELKEPLLRRGVPPLPFIPAPHGE